MSDYLIVTKGQKDFHSVAPWKHHLHLVTRIYRQIESMNLDPENYFVLEKKDYPIDTYRFRKRRNKKWYVSSYIDLFDEIENTRLYIYVQEHIEEYIKYVRSEQEEWNETPSMVDWVFRHDIAKQEYLYWLFDHNYITLKEL